MSKSSELQFNISKHVSLEKSVKIDKIEKNAIYPWFGISWKSICFLHFGFCAESEILIFLRVQISRAKTVKPLNHSKGTFGKTLEFLWSCHWLVLKGWMVRKKVIIEHHKHTKTGGGPRVRSNSSSWTKSFSSPKDELDLCPFGMRQILCTFNTQSSFSTTSMLNSINSMC